MGRNRPDAGEQSNKTASDKRRGIIVLIILLTVVTLVCIGVTVWAIWFRDITPVLAPDFAPVETEANAQPIEGEGDETLNAEDGGGAVSLTYAREVGIDLSEKKVLLLFGNPSKSNQDMVLQIVIKDTVVVQSGRLMPGNQVRTLKLPDSAKLAPGKYEGKFLVLYYRQDTGEKAMVNTEIPISITVSE